MLVAYDGVDCDALQARSGASRLVAVDHCDSTMDLAHDLAAAGAAHGTVVVTEAQGAGRGRAGKSWVSAPGSGVWASVVLRPSGAAHGGVLSLRVGLELAARLDAHADGGVRLKWPNDLYRGDRKLAGILAEARWRGATLEWIVVGVGVNVRSPRVDPPVASLDAGTTRADVLVHVVQAVLAAGAFDGDLSADELQRFATRDLAAGREISAPLAGTVLGISPGGGLRVRTAAGDAIAVAGSMSFRTF
ncbi:MAG: biotin--[acetyl-CoA-carboxylase] ligase [Gemmatimonadota bacterium]